MASDRFREWFDLMDQLIAMLRTTTPGTDFAREGREIVDRWDALMGEISAVLNDTSDEMRGDDVLERIKRLRVDVDALCERMGA